MKGPSQRLKYDLRRLWECPVCKRRERMAGSVTYRHCQCQMKQADGKPVVMKLIEDGVQRLGPAIKVQHEKPVFVDAAREESKVNPSEPIANPGNENPRGASSET